MGANRLSALLDENPWWPRVLAACLLTAACTNSFGVDINLIGLFPGKALVSVGGRQPAVMSAGQKTSDGVTLVAVSADSATFEVGGKRQVLRMGQAFRSAELPEDARSIVLSPDTTGHYFAVGAISGKSVRLLVDTGASAVALGAKLATQLGIDYRNGRPTRVSTANGEVAAHAITLDSVRIGGITLRQVEAVVSDGMNHTDEVLLGMSFLGRLTMQRDGQTMLLSPKGDATAGAGGKAAPTAMDKRDKLVLTEVRNGMFAVRARVNGVELPFLIDTGASSVSIDAALAQSAGLPFRNGTPGWSNTANGMVRSWRVKLDSIAVGPITLYGIDATVREGPGTGGIGLLGMTFLSRVEMKREGETLTLTKRF